MRMILKNILRVLDATPTEYGKEKQRGQSFVEMAFMTPILIIMVVGIAEIGWYANNYINLLEAAKVGARRGPHLNAEYAPQVFDDKASIAPQVRSSGYDVLPSPDDPGFANQTVQNDPRVLTRGIANPPYQRCEGVGSQHLGFYNIIICTVLDSLDPLPFRIGKDKDGKPYKDDIVVSVFSIQRINNGAQNGINPETDEPYDYPISTGDHTYPPGHQVVVVGRWPHNANECASGGARHPGDYRDPFDYIVNQSVDVLNVNTSTGKTVLLPLELANPILGPGGEVIGYSSLADHNIYEENQRGWAWTGQHRIQDTMGYETPCYGSEFSLQQVEELFNLPSFINDDANFQDRRQYLPSQGFVLVEIFWEHELLLDSSFPMLYGAYDLFTNLRTDEGSVIRVWAALPAPAAEPSITFRLN